MMTTITDVLEEVHKQYVGGDTDYPGTDESDFTIRLSHANNGIRMYDNEVSDGTQWPELIDEHAATGSGTGIDDLPDGFLATHRMRDSYGEHSAELYNGAVTYSEVTPAQGMQRKNRSQGGNIFWIAGGKLRSYPSLSGSFTLPYLRKSTIFETGAETTPIEMSRPVFLVYYILSMLCLKDRNSMGFQANQQLATEEMRRMKLDANRETVSESGFGIGM